MILLFENYWRLPLRSPSTLRVPRENKGGKFQKCNWEGEQRKKCFSENYEYMRNNPPIIDGSRTMTKKKMHRFHFKIFLIFLSMNTYGNFRFSFLNFLCEIVSHCVFFFHFQVNVKCDWFESPFLGSNSWFVYLIDFTYWHCKYYFYWFLHLFILYDFLVFSERFFLDLYVRFSHVRRFLRIAVVVKFFL